MRKVVATAATAVLVLSFAQEGARAQKRPRPSDAELRALRKEIESLKEGQQAIRAELEEIKRLLREVAESSARSRHQFVSVDDDPSVGESTARVVLIDFSDYQ